jgi:anthranilate phosphoribosyltransferase
MVRRGSPKLRSSASTAATLDRAQVGDVVWASVVERAKFAEETIRGPESPKDYGERTGHCLVPVRGAAKAVQSGASLSRTQIESGHKEVRKRLPSLTTLA